MNAILLALCFTQVVFDAETLDGDSYRGEVADWSDATLVLQDGDQRHALPVDKLQRLHQDAPKGAPQRPACWVEFYDGSRLAAVDVRTEGDQATIRMPWGSIPCPLRELHTVRWFAGEAELDGPWQATLQNTFEGDAVVVRRDATSLDFLEGTVRSLTDAAVAFEYDGQQVDLPRDRLAGLVLFRPGDPPGGTARLQVQLNDQSSLKGIEIHLEAGQVHVRTLAGVRLAVPITELAEVTFASPGLVYLSDLPAEQSTTTPVLQPSLATDRILDFLYRPRMNEGFGDRPLQLQFPEELTPRTYAKGLAVHSRTQLVYRLDEPFAQLRGVVGWDPESRHNGGQVQLSIRAGEKVLFEGTWRPDDPPVEIAVPLPDARRIELLVDYADGSDIGDCLHLCNFRLLK